MLCPRCHAPLDMAALRCTQGHIFPRRFGVACLLDERLEAQLAAIERHRDTVQAGLPPITDYDGLPFNLAGAHFEWRQRSQDAHWVLDVLARRFPAPCDVLEIGAWNGWLSHRIARAGHRLLAIDYFAHPDDGLGAKGHYSGVETLAWEAVQMDITQLRPINARFDLVILNHGLHLLPDPAGQVAEAMTLVKRGGLLLALNLTFFRQPEARAKQVAEMAAAFEAAYGLPLFLHPTRGYMDGGNMAQLRRLGLRLRPYWRRWRANLRALIHSKAPVYLRGLWQE